MYRNHKTGLASVPVFIPKVRYGYVSVLFAISVAAPFRAPFISFGWEELSPLAMKLKSAHYQSVTMTGVLAGITLPVSWVSLSDELVLELQ